MEDKRKLIEEIKELERELYIKRSKLASAEAMGQEKLAGGVDVEELRKAIKDLINLIGKHSKGGNSVEDIRKERDR